MQDGSESGQDPIADIARDLLRANQAATTLLTETVNSLSIRVEGLGAIVGELKDRLHSSPCSALTDHAKEMRKIERGEASNRRAKHWQILLLLATGSFGGLISLFVASVTKGI